MVGAKQEPTNQAEPVERKSLPEKLAREPEPRKRESEAPRAEQKPKDQAEPGYPCHVAFASHPLQFWSPDCVFSPCAWIVVVALRLRFEILKIVSSFFLCAFAS
jgi:hypothetical protein